MARDGSATDYGQMESLLQHLNSTGYKTLIDPRNRDIAYPMGNPRELHVASETKFHTDLTATLDTLQFDFHRARWPSKDAERNFRARHKQIRREFAFTWSRENGMPQHRWDAYLRKVQVIVLDHYTRSMAANKALTNSMKLLLTGSETEASSMQLSKVQRERRLLYTMCDALLAEHMFEPNPDPDVGDPAIIERLTGEAVGGNARNRTAEQRMKYERTKAEWKRVLARVRSTLSELFLWFIHAASSVHAQKDFEQVFRSHTLQQRADGGHELFNANIIIAHISEHYLTDNDDDIKAITRSFESMVRWKGESLLDWLDRFEQPLTELSEAREGLEAHPEAYMVKLWKRNFADNIHGREITAINNHLQPPQPKLLEISQ